MSQEKGYLIVTCKMDKTKMEDLKNYVQNARPIFASCGGSPIGQYEVADTEIGAGQTTHVIIMEFPNQDAVRSIFKDPNYQKLIPSRTQAFPVLDIMIGKNFDPSALMQR